MLKRALLLGVVLAVLCVWGPAPAVAASGIIQQKQLVATGTPQLWESTKRGANVYVHVFSRYGELEQRWVNGCRANYHNPNIGLYVWVRVKRCRYSSPTNPQPYLVRYLSVSGTQRFVVKLTRAG